MSKHLLWPLSRLLRLTGYMFLSGAVLSTISVIAPHGDQSFISAAHADDDDDDDSGHSGSNSGSGGGRSESDGGTRLQGPATLMDYLNNRHKNRDKKPRSAVRRQYIAPRYEPRRLVALGLQEDVLTKLQEQGFAITDRQQMQLTGMQLIRLSIPKRMTLLKAREQVSQLAPEAMIDYNHYYRPETVSDDNPPNLITTGCTGDNCSLVRHQIGWEMPDTTSRACNHLPKIGLIDTAVNPQHEALKDAHIELIRLSDEDLPQSGTQHGTAVAALLVGDNSSRAPGLLPDAQLIAVDAFHAGKRDKNRATTYDLIRAVDLLAQRQVTLINMSLSGPPNKLLEKTVEAVSQRKITLIAAAGNDGPHAKPVYPAAYSDVIAVTAVDRNNQPYRRAVRGAHIDLAAPGVSVWTAASVSGARTKTGTSFAAPFVTAAAARLKSEMPELDHQQITQKLAEHAKDLGKPGHDPVFGWGLLNVQDLCTG